MNETTLVKGISAIGSMDGPTSVFLAGKLSVGVFAAVIAIGILIGFFLGVSGEKFKVEVDEKEVAILGELPGNNCGGCGYAGCSGLAAAIVKGEAPVNQCPVGGAPVAAKIGEIMGVKAEEGERKAAFVKCAGTCEKANQDYEYTGCLLYTSPSPRD